MSRRTTGHTLIEAMTAVSIIAITLAIALPGFRDALQRNRTRTALHLVSTGMAMARSSAVMRRDQVVVCPRTNAGGCATDSDWSRGWVVFTDGDGNRRPDSEAHVLRSEDAPVQGVAGFRIVSSRPYLRYQQDGRSAHSNLTVHVCANGQVTGQVIVNNLGRVRTSYPKAATACPM